ncbi:MAG: flagellar assembly protein FliW [Nitrospirota bacterium]|nr:flagellar assembly protein FliW [Nitrospirota bacterium]
MSQKAQMRIATSRFGQVQCDADAVLKFPRGLVGIPELTHFVLLDGSGPLRWLQSVDEPEAAFVVADADLFVDAAITAAHDDLLLIGAEASVAAVQVLVLLTIPADDPSAATANLMAPLLINQDNRRGVQTVLPDHFPVQHPVASRFCHPLPAMV